MIRIIAGSAKGRRLCSPEGFEYRPTTARVKASVFSYLQHSVPGSSVLDLFSGTGSLGLEALSRGASHLVCVESSAKQIALLQKNVDLCGFSHAATIIRGDVFHCLRDGFPGEERFDLIFADPPFKMTLRERIVRAVETSGVLSHDGLLILEHESHDDDQKRHGMILIKQSTFGNSVVSVYRSTA